MILVAAAAVVTVRLLHMRMRVSNLLLVVVNLGFGATHGCNASAPLSAASLVLADETTKKQQKRLP